MQNNQNSRVALGLDLGVSFCRLSMFRDGKFELIPDEEGKFQMPTYIAFTDNSILIGEDAKDQLVKNPRNTIFNFKKLLGRRFSDYSVQEAIRGLLYRVEEGPGDKPLIVVTYRKEVRKFYPEEILSLLIQEMKKYSEAYLGK